jgi:hypothetical protein
MTEDDKGNFVCDGCGCTLELFDIEQEGKPGDPMWVVPEPGGEKVYCETCFAKR